MKRQSSKKTNLIEEDEINLIDILKVLWRWKYFVIGFVLIVMLIVIIFVKSKPIYYETCSIIELAKFGSLKGGEERVNYYLNSLRCIEECKNIIGDTELYRILEIDITAEKSKRDIIALNKVREIAKFKRNSLVVRLKNPSNAIKLNNALASLIVKRENKLLEEKLKKYKSQINQVIKNKKILISLSLPVFEESYIVLSADENIVEKIDKRKKVIIIAFFVSIFFAIFLVFILEFFKNLDWKQITSMK